MCDTGAFDYLFNRTAKLDLTTEAALPVLLDGVMVRLTLAW